MSQPLVARRELLRRSLAVGATIAGGGVLAACEQRPFPAEAAGAPLPPPETTTVRWVSPPPCDPLWNAKDYLLAEGFTDLQIVPITPTTTEWLTADKADFNTGGYPSLIATNVDAGLPIVCLAGIHPGCYELFATPGIGTIRDLRGKTIAVNATNASDQFYGFFSILLAYVGVDQRTEVNFIEVGPDLNALRDAFVDGRSQAPHSVHRCIATRRIPARSSSTQRWTSPGRSTTAAPLWRTATGHGSIRSRPSG